jgi:hypothetical protein
VIEENDLADALKLLERLLVDLQAEIKPIVCEERA